MDRRGGHLTGLDLGTTKVLTAIAQRQGEGRLALLGVGIAPSRGMRKGVVVDIEEAASAIRESVERAGRMAGVEVRRAFVGVTGHHISSLNSRGVVAVARPDRQVSPEDMRRAIEASKMIVIPPEREIIHVIPRSFILDGQEGIKKPVGMAGTRLEVEAHIVTGISTFIRNVERAVERAGVGVEGVVMEVLAAGEAVLTEAERQLGVVLADVGGGTTDVAVFYEGEICHSAALPAGGNHITRDIAVGLKTPLEEAERLKVNHGCALARTASPEELVFVPSAGGEGGREVSKRALAEIIELRVREILEMARAEMEKSGLSGLLGAGVVLTGGTSLLPGIVELAEAVFDLPARVGRPKQIRGLTEDVAIPAHSAGIGLVLWTAKAEHELERPVPGFVPKSILRQIRDFFLRVFGFEEHLFP